jgi:hypothetical protein
MIQRPVALNAFEFAVMAGLRAAQLTRGSVPRVEGSTKVTVIAQREIAEGKVAKVACETTVVDATPPPPVTET